MVDQDGIEMAYQDHAARLACDTVADDESWQQAQARERQERRALEDRKALAGPNVAVRYRSIAQRSPLLRDAEFRLLCNLIDHADPDLTNSFPGCERLRLKLGGPARRSSRRVRGLVASLAAKGFLHRGRGYQFLLPGDAMQDGRPWAGPCRWDNRIRHGDGTESTNQ